MRFNPPGHNPLPFLLRVQFLFYHFFFFNKKKTFSSTTHSLLDPYNYSLFLTTPAHVVPTPHSFTPYTRPHPLQRRADQKKKTTTFFLFPPPLSSPPLGHPKPPISLSLSFFFLYIKKKKIFSCVDSSRSSSHPTFLPRQKWPEEISSEGVSRR